MTAVMEGVRILEVAEHTFVPAASALLADWGAEVVKIEHVERGDAMRGLASSGLAVMGTTVHVLLEHSNRGKQSLGLDLTTPEGLGPLAVAVEHRHAHARPGQVPDGGRPQPTGAARDDR